MSCTCDVVHTLCRWCYVQVVLCTCCTYGTGVHVVFCACPTCCVAGMWYHVCALCSYRIVTCVFTMFYSGYIYVLCYTSDVGICIVLCCTLGLGVCVICQV